MPSDSTDKCYLCGATENLTRDHIPPKCLFPKPLPKKMYTVSCCYQCNNSASKEDEYLRLATSGLINSHPTAQVAFDRVIESTLPARRIGELIDELRAGIKPIILKTPAGDMPASKIPADASTINRSLVRITKGILAGTYPNMNTADLDFEITHLDQFKLDSLVTSGVTKLFSYWSVGDGVYQNWRAVSAEEKAKGMMVHAFYGAAVWMLRYQPGRGIITLTNHSSWTQSAPGSLDDRAPGSAEGDNR